MTAKQRAERIIPEARVFLCETEISTTDHGLDGVVQEYDARIKERDKVVRAIAKLLTDDRKAVVAFIRRQNAMVSGVRKLLREEPGVHDAFVNDICKRIENPSLPLE